MVQLTFHSKICKFKALVEFEGVQSRQAMDEMIIVGGTFPPHQAQSLLWHATLLVYCHLSMSVRDS